MYAAEDNAAQLAAFGFSPSDYSDEVVEVWPENIRAVNLFSSICTQWLVSANGAYGIDYNVMFYLIDRMRLNDEEHAILFDDMRVIEAEALSIMNKKDD